MYLLESPTGWRESSLKRYSCFARIYRKLNLTSPLLARSGIFFENSLGCGARPLCVLLANARRGV